MFFSNVSRTCSRSFLRRRPLSTKTPGELLADGAVDERGGHGGVDAAGEAENDFFVTDLLADLRDGFGDVVAMTQSAEHLQMSSTKRLSISRPLSVCVTSGWNWTA